MDSLASVGRFLQVSAEKFETSSLFATCALDASSFDPSLTVKELDLVSMIGVQFWKTLYRTNKVFSNLVHNTVESLPLSADFKRPYVVLFDDLNYLYRSFVKSFCDQVKPEEEAYKNTVLYLYKIFGKKRVDRIAKELRSDFSNERQLRTIFVLEMKYLFYAITEVYADDLQDLLDEIHTSELPIRFLTRNESCALKEYFKDRKTIDHCSNEHLDRLFAILVPFKRIEDVFCNSIPKDKIGSLDSGKTFYGLRHRVLAYEKIRRKSLSTLEWSCMAVKVLSDLEMPKGVVFRNENGGYCTVHEIIHGKGAYKTLLKQIGAERKNVQNVILYRGTRVPPFATGAFHTLFEDMRKDLGSLGPIATFEETKKMLTNSEMGFIEDENETVKAIGMSLGGSHSMRDAYLHFGKISHVMPIASPGIDDEIDKKFREKIEQSDFKIRIEHIWEYDDVIDQFGKVHMGCNLDPEKVDVQLHLLHQEDAQITTEEVFQKAKQYREFPKNSNSIANLALGLFKLQEALRCAHIRKTTEETYRIVSLNNKEHIDCINSILAHSGSISDTAWEEMRNTFTIDQWPLDGILLPDFVFG